MNYKFLFLFSGILLSCLSLILKTQNTNGTGFMPENPKTLKCSFEVDSTFQHKISEYLVGFNVIYPHEKDIFWENGKITGFLTDIGTSLIRYPGGTVTSFYHWDSLSGNGWADSWDPANSLTQNPGSEYMDIDEFMKLIRRTGATPMLGINMSSGWKWDRIDDGINEALALMKYCHEKKFDVKFWYLDNEPYQHDSNGGAKTPKEYAELINKFAPRMKNFKPDIKIIANWNAGFSIKRNEYEILLREAGKNIDIIDAHWYWAWQQPDQAAQWLAKTPMERWTKDTYMEEIAMFRKLTKELGFQHIKLASLEWNAGPDADNKLNPSQSAMIQAEMLMQYVIGGLDMAAFWPIHWPDTKQWKVRGLINTENFSVNPNFPILQFFGELQGSWLLNTNQQTQIPNTLFFACIDDGNLIKLAFLNKNLNKVKAEINLSHFRELKVLNAETIIISNNGSENKIHKLKKLNISAHKIKFTSDPLAFTMLTLKSN